jgi:hypothetical protein
VEIRRGNFRDGCWQDGRERRWAMLIQLLSNIISELHASHRTEQVHLMGKDLMMGLARKNRGSYLIVSLLHSSLARNKNPEYYSCRCRNIGSDVHLAWVDVLYIVVETRATTTGFGASRRFLYYRPETPEPFLLDQSRNGRKANLFVHML